VIARIGIARIVAVATFLAHLATLTRYGYFRDELYFIACARHLAWGYVDQPPLVAFAAWLATPFAFNLVALRILPALASALAAGLAVVIARELGGGRFAQWLAGVCVALLPAFLLLGNTLTTTSFESISWLLAIWCTIRIARGGPAWWWALLGGALAFGLYGKYSIALLAIALPLGLLATRERRALATPWLLVCAGVALALIGPNLLWQASHDWPMLAVLHGDAAGRHAFNTGVALEYRDLWTNARAFALEQVLYTNPFGVPVWLAGVLAPFFLPRLRDVRFLSIAYVLLFALAIALGAKGYYIIGIYGGLLAVGSVAIEALAGWLRAGIFVAVAAAGIILAPISLPVLTIQQYVAYSDAFHMAGTPPRLTQPIYAEMFGWERLAQTVAGVYHALPAAQRARATIYADTYADAGAIDLFGPRYGLPSAISGQNSYYLWGTHGNDGTTLIAIGATRIAILQRYYGTCALVTTSNEPLKWVVEGPDPIYLCTHPRASLDAIWPNLRWYGA
jgi:hypothetical protein